MALFSAGADIRTNFNFGETYISSKKSFLTSSTGFGKNSFSTKTTSLDLIKVALQCFKNEKCKNKFLKNESFVFNDKILWL